MLQLLPLSRNALTKCYKRPGSYCIRHQAVVGEGGGKNQSVGKVQAKFFECPFVGQQVRVGKVMHASIIG